MKILLYKISSGLLFILFALIVNGQSNPPSIYEIKSDTDSATSLPDSCYKMLEDKNGKWSISDVTSASLHKKFHDRTKKIYGIDTLVNTYWFYYRLENKMPVDAKISLNSMSEYDDFYLLQNEGKWKHYKSGFLIAWKNKDGLKWGNFIPLVLEPGELITIYQRIHNIHKGLPQNFAVSIYNTENAIQENYVEILDSGINTHSTGELQEAFMIGILLLSIFF